MPKMAYTGSLLFKMDKYPVPEILADHVGSGSGCRSICGCGNSGNWF